MDSNHTPPTEQPTANLLAELETIAPQLGAAHQQSTEAAAAYKAQEAAWLAQPHITALAVAKKTAGDAKTKLEVHARAVIAEYFRREREKPASLYFTLRTSPEVVFDDDEAEDKLIDWLIREAPFLARQFLRVDTAALNEFIKANAVPTDEGGFQLAPALKPMPIERLENRLTTVINWSKLPTQATEPGETDEQPAPEPAATSSNGAHPADTPF